MTSITGTLSACAGSTSALGNATAGGTWSTGSSSIATIGSATGIVTAVSAGTTQITYALAGGCRAISTFTVNASPTAITGSLGMCIGGTTTLASTPAGGTWSSSATGVATVNSSGVVTSVSAGNATITYTSANGCYATATVTVNSAPTINGTLAVCTGTSTTLTSPTPGGTWTSSNLPVASIGATTGVLSGFTVGTANITYAISATCKASVVATVSSGTATISGATTVCSGSSITLTPSVAGGTWTSANTSRATVGAATGIVTGVGAGTVYITYSIGGGCYATKLITVGGALGGITGATGLCIGATTTYISTSPSVGTGWTSGNTAVATVGAASGVVTGISAGTATITFTPYSFSAYAGCVATKVVTVDAAPSVPAITGPTAVQVGHTITLANATPGGTWTSNLPSRATVSSSGVVTGISVPAATISYSVANGACTFTVTKLITIVAAKPGIDPSVQAELSIFPNPTSGTFTVKTNVSGAFSVYSIDGKEVHRSSVTEGLNAISLPRDLSSGVYMCRFVGDDQSNIMIRLVLENQ